MGRPLRIHFNGAIYHAMDRGVNRQNIFIDDRDRETFLSLLRQGCADASAELLAYCLMGNHFHLAVKVSAVPLAEIMQRLLTAYARIFNHRHERTGHLFEGRYTAKPCLTERYLRTVIAYIIMNPVQAGLVSRPEDWPWSSLLDEPLTPEILAELENFDPWAKEGGSDFDLHRREAPVKIGLDELGERICPMAGVSLEILRADDRRRFVTDAKRLFTKVALTQGHKVTAIARWLDVDASRVTRYARSNTANRKA